MVDDLIKDRLDLLSNTLNKRTRVLGGLRNALLNLKFEDLNVKEVRWIDSLVFSNQLLNLLLETWLKEFHFQV